MNIDICACVCMGLCGGACAWEVRGQSWTSSSAKGYSCHVDRPGKRDPQLRICLHQVRLASGQIYGDPLDNDRYVATVGHVTLRLMVLGYIKGKLSKP